MGSRAVSPGGALLRSSRMFSVPKPLPEPQSTTLRISQHKSETMTRPYPQHQSVISPQTSREKGDWGFKRPFPLKTTMATSTPVIRVKQVDYVESVTDFASAADYTLSLEKFQELRVALSIPKGEGRSDGESKTNLWFKSVFEEHMDFTDLQHGQGNEQRWKFEGPWLARMTEGDFIKYVEKRVRPRRAQFRALLRDKLAEDMTIRQNNAAQEAGQPAPRQVEAQEITEEQFTEYLRLLRNDRATLYAIVSKFLDMAPLGQPIGVAEMLYPEDGKTVPESPYGKNGPPPCHPSAGISYLRTSSFMDNHPVYGPQGKRTPALARVVCPRMGPAPAKLGVGGFVATTPAGDNEFNLRHGLGQRRRRMLKGILHLDTTTPGGAKAYVDPATAIVDPSGKVVLRLHEANPEAQVIAKESKGLSVIYGGGQDQHKEESSLDSQDWA